MTNLNKALKASLREWLVLIREGPPRQINELEARMPDAVIFTDGSFPEGRSDSLKFPWIGGVLFLLKASNPSSSVLGLLGSVRTL